jgi:beta-glucanase (GH16 family)
MKTKCIISMSLIVICSAGCHHAPKQVQSSVAPVIPGYKLLWADEFDGTDINDTNWTHEVGDNWHNGELQAYTDRDKNSYVDGGKLVLIALKESYHDKHFTSARLRTAGKQDFMFGRIEARIKLPFGGGMWPAFWMMPSEAVYGRWAASGEIDIVEARDTPMEVYAELHYGGKYPDNARSSAASMTATSAGSSAYSDGTDFSQAYHTYAFEWEPTQMRWYCDGNLFKTVTNWWSGSKEDNGTFPAPFDQDFHILLNLAVGGEYVRCTKPECIAADFPQKMQVDYVRVYQKK